MKRVCFECDHRYKGGLNCPRCGGPGEPLEGGLVKALVIAGLTLVLSACGGAPKSVDWTALASEARPTFEKGPCGAQLKWTRELEVTEDVEIVGELTIRPKCPEQ